MKYKANHPSNDGDASDNLVRLSFQRFASFIIIIIMSWCHVVVLKMSRLGDTFCALRDICHAVNTLDEALLNIQYYKAQSCNNILMSYL